MKSPLAVGRSVGRLVGRSVITFYFKWLIRFSKTAHKGTVSDRLCFHFYHFCVFFFYRVAQSGVKLSTIATSSF